MKTKLKSCPRDPKVIKKMLIDFDLSQADIARSLGYSRQYIYQVIYGLAPGKDVWKCFNRLYTRYSNGENNYFTRQSQENISYN
jgi:predicted transcriptional regulator